MRNVKTIVAIASLGLMTASWAVDEAAPENGSTATSPTPFAGEMSRRAKYAVYVSWASFRAGDAVITWKNTGDQYEIVSETKTVGAAAALHKFSQTQISRGRITSQGLVPETYVNTRSGKEAERMTYDWKTLKATINTPGNQREFDIAPGAQDILTLPYQLAYLASSSATTWPRTVLVGTGKRINAYQVTLVGEVKKKTDLGTVDTWQFKGVQDPADSSTEIWVGKKPYLLTTIRFINPGAVNLNYDIEKMLPLDEESGKAKQTDQPTQP